VEIGPAEFAVRDALQAGGLLGLYDFGDGPILDSAQLRARDLALGRLVAGLEELARAKKTADVVGAEGGGCAWGHESHLTPGEGARIKG
jgi:hypothetical protein